jgi:uncharacterized protein YjbI with pentapeptide repeats
MIKEDIKKILDMTRSGSISDEDAAELLAALSESKSDKDNGNSEEDKKGKASHKADDFFGLNFGHLDDVVNTFINRAFKAVKSTRINVSAKDKDENLVNMSRFAPPEGEDFTFSENQIQLCSIDGIKLNRSEFTDNHFQGSHVNGIDAFSSKIVDCQINGSSIDQLTIKDSEFSDTKINGSKISGLALSCASKISDSNFNGVIIKTLEIMNSSELSDSKFNAVSFTNSSLDASRIEDCNVTATKFIDTKFIRAQFSDCNFRECKILNSSLSEIHLKDLNIRGLVLQNLTITGNAEFLKIAGEQHAI